MVKSLIRGAALSAMIVLLMISGIVAADEIVAVDLKPGSCEDSINVKSKGVTPFVILGEVDFDVRKIDPVTILIGEAVFDGFSYALAEPVRPLRSGYEDVGTPDICDAGADGIEDMTLKFNTQSIVGALGAITEEDLLADGNDIMLIFSGIYSDETGDMPFFGGAAVSIKSKGKGNPNFGKPF